MQKLHKKIKQLIFPIFLFTGLLGFAQDDVKITEIKFNEPSTTFQLGGFTIQYKILPENATNKTLTWESDNPEVVSVRNGYISVKKAGTATITATAQDGSGVSGKITITAIKLINSISFNEGSTIYLRPDGAKNYPLRVTIDPYDATNQNLKWETNDESVVSVTNKGEITTHKIGNAYIRATAQDGSAAFAILQVNVIIPVEKVTINEGNVTLSTYASKQLTTTVIPADAPATIRWYSSNQQIATVDKNGLLTARGTPGEATITAYADDEYAGYPESKIKVTVVNAPVSDLVVYPYQRDMELKWYPSGAETEWQVIYNEKGSSEKATKFTKTPSAVLRDLKPKTVYEIQVSASANGQSTSLPVNKEAQTTALSEGNKFPHLYNIKNIKVNEAFPLIWKDLEDATTGVTYQLRNVESNTVITDVMQVNDTEKTVTFSKSGSYRLVISFTNNRQTWEEVSYNLNIK